MDSAQASAAPAPALSNKKLAPQQAIVWVLFLFSGICGLIYEVLWCRHLGLLFGNTVQSMSAVLTAFMAGLALGSYLGGRICHTLKRPMMIYGFLELAIGIYCAFLPWAFSADSPIIPFYRNLYGEAGGGAALSVARFTISFILLLIPTTFMGATLPVLAQYLVRSRAFLGKTVGALYAINTFGAVLGAALTGFVLLPVLGKAESNWIAVGTNIILGALAVIFGMNESAPPQAEREENEAEDRRNQDNSTFTGGSGGQEPVSPLALRLAIFTFGLTGFAALTTQIGWNHALSLAMGSSTYVFSLIVSVFILGLSFGGMWGSRAAEKTNDPLALLGKVLIATGLGTMALTVILGIGPTLMFPISVWSKAAGWTWQLFFQAAGVALLIIGPTFLMGATMPLTMQVAARSDGAPGRTVGTIYAVNTVGSILGSFFGGLVLLPWLKIQGTLHLMSLLYALPGLALYLLSKSGQNKKPRSEFISMLVAMVAIVGVLFGSNTWDPLTMASGTYLLRDERAQQAVRDGRWSEAFPDPHKNTELKYYSEGATATVAVTQLKDYYTLPPDDVKDEPLPPPEPIDKTKPVVDPPFRAVYSMTVGGKPDASSHGDMCTQMGLTLVPLMLHEHPEDVLVIGLGSGASAGAALSPDTVKNVDVVEMSPEVVEASFFFAEFTGLKYKPIPGSKNLNWLDTPRLNLIINDGRNHLLLTSRKYDVIASEPSNPWLAGVGNLFTREAFKLSSGHLKPDGIMCQWIHSYSLEETDFLSIVKTFGDVFPQMQLWCVNRRDFLLIGSAKPICMNAEKLRARMRQPAANGLLKSIHFESEEEFLACFISTDSELRAISKDSDLHTDDNMRLEFSAPKALYNTTQLMRSTRLEPDPESILDYSMLSNAERHERTKLLDLAADGREHTRCAFEHAGNRIDHWSKALALAPKQFWAAEYAPFIKAALAKRPPEPVTPRDSALDAIEATAETDAEKALGELQKLNQQRAAAGAKTFECVELAIELMRRSGRRAEAVKTLTDALNLPDMSDNPNAAKLWEIGAEMHLETDSPDPKVALRLASRAKTLFQKSGSPSDAVARAAFKLQDYLLAYNEYRDLCATNPKVPEFNTGLADVLLAISAAPNLRAEHPELALRNLRYARRLAREAALFLPADPNPWLRLAQANLELSKVDAPAAAFHKSEALAATKEFVALDKAGVLAGITPEIKGANDLVKARLGSKLPILERAYKMPPSDFLQLFHALSTLKN